MMRVEVFPSKYLKGADLKGKPRIVKIESARYDRSKAWTGKKIKRSFFASRTFPSRCH